MGWCRELCEFAKEKKVETSKHLAMVEILAEMAEMGYESNPDEDVKLNDGAYQDKLIEGYVNALERWNNKYTRPKVSQPENNGVM